MAQGCRPPRSVRPASTLRATPSIQYLATVVLRVTIDSQGTTLFTRDYPAASGGHQAGQTWRCLDSAR